MIILLSAGAGYGLVRTFLPVAGKERFERTAAGALKPAAREAAATPARGAAFTEVRDFLKSLDSAKLEDLPALWASLPPEKSEEGQAQLPDFRRMMVMERWAELDAPGALEFAKQQKEKGFRFLGFSSNMVPVLVMGVFSVWSLTDPEAAMAAMREEKDRETQAAAAVGWLRSVSGDPAAFVAHASQLTWLDVSKLTKELFLGQVSQDFLETLHAAEPGGLKQLASWMPPWFKEMLEALDWRKSLRDRPDEALATLESMPLTKDKLEEMLSSLEPLAKTQPERVADLLTKLADRPGDELLTLVSWNEGPRRLLETLITTLGPENPERMAALLEKVKGNVPGAEILTDTLLRTNPAAALKIAPGLGAIDQLAKYVLSPPPSMDSGAALDLVKDSPPSYYRDKILERALLELNGKDPQAAQAWIGSLPEGEARDSAQLTLDLASASPEARMLERVGRQNETKTGSLDENTTKRVGIVTATAAMDDFPGTLSRVSAWPEGPARDTALGVLGSLAASNDDPQRALQWAAALPEESQRTAAYAGIAKGWTGADPVAASEWVAALPEGPVRESAVGGFAGSIAARDPEAGLQWAATLTDPGARLQRLREVTDLWKAKDAPAATEAIRGFPGLSDADRTALLQSLK